MRFTPALFLLSALARVQVETTTSITGTVADQSGAVMSGAAVKLTSQNTGAVRQTVTNPEGVYSFQSLPAGTYTISASAQGFKTATITDRVVQTAQSAHLDIKLEVGSTTEQVTGSAAGAAACARAGRPLVGDVQRLAGRADPRTIRLYDCRQKKITRNIVERISI